MTSPELLLYFFMELNGVWYVLEPLVIFIDGRDLGRERTESKRIKKKMD